jgi:MSHA biogenesis protein MshN
MSLINEVLNKLEQRGAHTSPNQTQIRAVAQANELNWMKPVIIAGGLLFLLALWWLWPKPPVPVAAVVLETKQVVPTSVLSVPDIKAIASNLPASKLSYELNTALLPDALREKKPAKAEVAEQMSLALTLPNKPEPPVIKPPEQESPAVPVQQFTGGALKQVSRTQQADAEYRKARVLQQQGHSVEALAGYETAIKLNAQQDTARLALAALLLENKRGADAERVLHDGLKLKPSHTGLSMALARVQVEQGKIELALATIQRNLAQAEGNAEYQAFYAALLQRQGRHKEAVNHYQIATQLAPNSGVWLMGFGISLQEVQRVEDAKEAYRKALASHSLTPQLTAFVEQKLKAL